MTMASDFAVSSFIVNFWTVVAPARLAPSSAIPANATEAKTLARFIAVSPDWLSRCGGGEGTKGSARVAWNASRCVAEDAWSRDPFGYHPLGRFRTRKPEG